MAECGTIPMADRIAASVKGHQQGVSTDGVVDLDAKCAQRRQKF
jgi:hypothetical protein